MTPAHLLTASRATLAVGLLLIGVWLPVSVGLALWTRDTLNTALGAWLGGSILIAILFGFVSAALALAGWAL